MDKEMMEKVNEILKKNGKRELSLDELNHVSGGITLVGHEIKTEEDVKAVCDVFHQIENTYGQDLAASWINDEMGDSFTLEDYRNIGIDGLYKRLCKMVADGANH